MLTNWKVMSVIVLAVLLLVLTDLIGLFVLMFVPMAGVLTLFFHSYEIRFANPVSSVWDHGDAIEVERHGIRQTIPLSQIRDISFRTINTPPYSVVELKEPCRWGMKITWFPDTSRSRDVARATIADLQKRIAAAQRLTPPRDDS